MTKQLFQIAWLPSAWHQNIHKNPPIKIKKKSSTHNTNKKRKQKKTHQLTQKKKNFDQKVELLPIYNVSKRF